MWQSRVKMKIILLHITHLPCVGDDFSVARLEGQLNGVHISAASLHLKSYNAELPLREELIL